MSNQLPSSFDGDTEFYEENRWQKFSRKLKQEPFVPLGCLATCYALYRATIAMRKGDHNTTNRMFRWRIYGQGFTLVAIVAGSMYYKTERDQRKIFTDELAKQKAVEKRDAWIRELEARDKEDQDYKANRRAMLTAAEDANKLKRRSDEASSIVEVGKNGGLGILEAVRDSLSGSGSS